MNSNTSRNSVKLLVLFVLALGNHPGCSGSQTPAMPATPEAETRATLAGPLCDSQECQCTDDPSKIGVAEAGLKRFRVELGPTESLLWASIDNNVFYKGVERAEACFYVDLPEGEHPISLRAKGEAGFGARMRISEVGGEGPWLYGSFDFNCGAPGLCDMASLRDWKESIKGVDAGKYAPCGSVRILGIDWITGRMPDNLHPADFRLDGTMKIYKFLPHSPPGSEDCVKQ
jgi:hypothetical protein